MKRKRGNDSAGMTLLEVLVAVFVLAIVALPLLNMFAVNTELIAKVRDYGDTTYAAQALMEELQPLGYGELYDYLPAPGAQGDYTIASVQKKISVDRIPSGTFDAMAASGKACYAHLVVNGADATFICPDGTAHTGPCATPIDVRNSQVSIGGKTYNLNKPAGTDLILVINAGTADIPSLAVNLNGSATYVLYALSPSDPVVQNISVSNPGCEGREYRKFNSKAGAEADPPPRYMLVNVTCRVYGKDTGALESVAQDTLKVSLP